MVHSTSPSAGDEFVRLTEEHLAELAKAGYAANTLTACRRSLIHLGRLASEHGVALRDLTGDRAAALIAEHCKSWRHKRRVQTRYAARRFGQYLVDRAIAVPPSPTPQQVARQALRQEYETYLQLQRGLSERTISASWRVAEQFLTHRFGTSGDHVTELVVADIVDFLLKLTDRQPPYRDKTSPTHLRAFLTFLFRTGRTRTNLALCIPSVAQRYAARLPRHLSPEDVERVIAAVSPDAPMGRRNRAMVLILARLGLRACEAVAMQLADLDWRTGELTVRGKGKRHDRMPIPPDVGEAIVDYLRHERRGTSRSLFVHARAPHRPFKDSQIFNSVLKSAFAAAGLPVPQRHVGSHVLRHSLATALLRQGASLEEVGDVLRHRSRSSTMIYAKVDLDRLRMVARPWPDHDADRRRPEEAAQ